MLEIRTSQNGTTWTDWATFRPVQYTFRFAEFRVQIGTSDVTKTPEVNQLKLSVDVPDFPFRKTVTVAVGGTRVYYGHTYYQQVALSPAAIGEGLHPDIIAKTLEYCDVKVKNAANQDVGGSLDLSGNGF